MWRGVTIGASSRLGTGGAMTVSPEGKRRTQLPLAVVPTNRADSDPTRSGACGRGTEDLATRWRRDFRLDVREASRFLTFSEELGGLAFSATVEDESVAVFSALSGTSLGGGSVFSAGEDPAPCNASLACDGPSAGAGGSTARLLIANWGEAELLSTSGLAGLASPVCSVRRRPAPTVPSRTLVCRYLSASELTMPLVGIRADPLSRKCACHCPIASR